MPTDASNSQLHLLLLSKARANFIMSFYPSASDIAITNRLRRSRTSDAIPHTSHRHATSQGRAARQGHRHGDNTTTRSVSFSSQNQNMAPPMYPRTNPAIRTTMAPLPQTTFSFSYPVADRQSVPPALPTKPSNNFSPANAAAMGNHLPVLRGSQGSRQAPQYASHPSQLNARPQLAAVQNHIPFAPPEYDPRRPVARATPFQNSTLGKPAPFAPPANYGHNSRFSRSVNSASDGPNLDCSGLIQDAGPEVTPPSRPDTPVSTASSGCSQDMNFRANVKPETMKLVDRLLVEDFSTPGVAIKTRMNELFHHELNTEEEARLMAEAMGRVVDKIGRGTTSFSVTFKGRMRNIIRDVVLKLFDDQWQASNAESEPVEGSSAIPGDTANAHAKPLVVASFISRLFHARILKVPDVQHCLQILVDHPVTFAQLSAIHAMLKYANYRIWKTKYCTATSRLYNQLKNNIDKAKMKSRASGTNAEAQLSVDILEWIRYLKLDANLKSL
ncbi:hypothetical protein BDZ97DRAFT_543479 [Flammula alnicola]|nr:hypothetical protein BDZ97DRAFT_543479 [Flammula alnicola]